MRILVAFYPAPIAPAVVAFTIAAVAFPAPAQVQQTNKTPAQQTQTLYRWKDARGINHYSQEPPRSGKYTTQTLPAAPPMPTDSRAPDAHASAPSSPDHTATSADPRCDTAYKNVQVLQGTDPVMIDSDGDGKPDQTLNDIERGNQLELARATLKAHHCGDGPPAGSQG